MNVSKTVLRPTLSPLSNSVSCCRVPRHDRQPGHGGSGREKAQDFAPSVTEEMHLEKSRFVWMPSSRWQVSPSGISMHSNHVVTNKNGFYKE